MSVLNNASNHVVLAKSNYRNSAVPTWVSSTQISLAYVVERANSNNCDIVSLTSLTLSTGTAGANGILTSPNLAGTVTYSSSSTTVTGSGTSFTTSFVVGDVIQVAGMGRQITSISSATSLTVNLVFGSSGSGASYQLGGVSPSCIYYLYAISKANGVSPALALCNRSVACGYSFPTNALPAGYSEYRELPFSLYLNASSNIYPFFVAEGWPYSPSIMYYQDHNNYSTTPLLLFSGNVTATSSAAQQAVNCSSVIPLTATKIFISCWKGTSNNRIAVSEPNGTSSTVLMMDMAYSTEGQICIVLGSPQVGQYQMYSMGGSCNVRMMVCDGYKVDGVV
jgi:hypothetical protein